ASKDRERGVACGERSRTSEQVLPQPSSRRGRHGALIDGYLAMRAANDEHESAVILLCSWIDVWQRFGSSPSATRDGLDGASHRNTNSCSDASRRRAGG